MRKRCYLRQFISVHLAVYKSLNTFEIAVVVMLTRHVICVSPQSALSFVIFSHVVDYGHRSFSFRLLWRAFMPLGTQDKILILTGFNNVLGTLIAFYVYDCSFAYPWPPSMNIKLQRLLVVGLKEHTVVYLDVVNKI